MWYVSSNLFVNGCFSNAFDYHIYDNNKRDCERFELQILQFLPKRLSRSFVGDGDVVGNQQIFPSRSPRALHKHFLQETFGSHGRLCVGCNNSCDPRFIFRYEKAISRIYC